MTAKIKEYLLSLAPLFCACPILYLINVPSMAIVLFSISYLWHLFLAHPGTEEKMSRKGYRFAFVRLIYLLFFKLNQWINKKNFFVVESLLRALGPFLFMGIFHYFFGGVNFYFLASGSVFFELFLFTRQQIQARVPPPLP